MRNALARSTPRSLAGALAVMAGAAVVAGCGASSGSGPRPAAPKNAEAAAVPLSPIRFTHDDPVGDPPEAQLLPVLERAAEARLPRDQYACVVAPPGERSRLRVLVRSPSAVPAARSIIRRLNGARYATVRVDPSERLARDRQALIAELRRQAGRYGDRFTGVATVMEGSIVDRTTCGPIVLRDPPHQVDLHDWVQRAAAAHPGAVEVRPALTVRPTRIYRDTLGVGQRSAG